MEGKRAIKVMASDRVYIYISSFQIDPIHLRGKFRDLHGTVPGFD